VRVIESSESVWRVTAVVAKQTIFWIAVIPTSVPNDLMAGWTVACLLIGCLKIWHEGCGFAAHKAAPRKLACSNVAELASRTVIAVNTRRNHHASTDAADCYELHEDHTHSAREHLRRLLSKLGVFWGVRSQKVHRGLLLPHTTMRFIVCTW
jgi:hypothetical protein